MPERELMDRLFWDKIDTARRMKLAERMMAGPELFDMACRITRSGIRLQRPEFSEQQVEAELERRLAISRQLERPA